MLTLHRVGLASLTLVAGLLAAGCGSDAAEFINNPLPAQLVFVQPPQNGIAGQTLPDIVVELQDQNGVRYSQANGTVQLQIANNPGNAQLLLNGNPVPNITVQGSGGVATFSGVGISAPGQGYTLVASVIDNTSGIGLTATSPAFNIASNGGVTSAVYLRSQEGLWDPEGGESDLAAMDQTFGVGNYTTGNFESVNVATLFQPGQFIFMDGGDQGTLAFDAFVTANRTAIENWVQSGGRAFINAAPNVVGPTFALPFGIVLENTLFFNVRVEAAHPIGVAHANNLDFSGSSYAHAFVAGDGLLPITREVETENNRIVVGELNPGSGRVLFGGITTSNFHAPEAQAIVLYANYLRYAAGLPLVTPPDVVPAKADVPAGRSSH